MTELPPIDVSKRATPVDTEDALNLVQESLDPEFHYRWVHDRGQRAARMQAKGYSPVLEDEGVQTMITPDAGGDGKIRIGDLVLWKIRKSRYNANREELARFTRSRLAAPKSSFKKKARKAGYSPTED